MLAAVDIGNSKADLLVLDDQGTVLRWVRGARLAPTHLSDRETTGRIAQVLAPHRVEHLWLGVAGIDFEDQEHSFSQALVHSGITAQCTVRNDIHALLHCAGTPDQTRIAVVLGAGMNAVGVRGADEVRFVALGEISGDLGGGGYLGMAAVVAACRAADRRGPATTLHQAVPEFLGASSIDQMSRDLYEQRIDHAQVVHLAEVAVRHARAGDQVALGLVEHQAREVVAFIRACATRLEVGLDDCHVVLGGSILRHGRDLLQPMIAAELAPARPELTIPDVAPVAGAGAAVLEQAGRVVEAAQIQAQLDAMTPEPWPERA